MALPRHAGLTIQEDNYDAFLPDHAGLTI